ncbi:MAG: ABC transporter [Bacteroidetes bacterium 4572_112]|nr:MAG: ABC transporter [Bacteroidetes bacterium 4572_112]
MVIFRLIHESFVFAVQSLMSNKLQTALSLLGITIGIFSVITVFTLIDSLESKIRTSINSLGSEVVYVQKWPWIFGDYPWWKFYQRPVPNIKDMQAIQKRSKTAEYVAFTASTNKSVAFKNERVESCKLVASTYDYKQINDFDLNEGRYFSSLEMASGHPVVIIGYGIAEVLFKGINPIGKRVKILGRKLNVIGVFAKEGKDMLNKSHDNTSLIPVNFARNVVNLRSGRLDPTIMVIPREGISSDRLKDDIRAALRAEHRLKPAQDDDFALNEISTIITNFDSLFKTISIAGWVIGGLSLLVGGFGIANIMFVSVRERTSQIGIQKALGAKNFFILFQFLFESVFLSLFGGLFGLIIVSTGVAIASYGFDFPLIMSLGNITLGIMVSLLIGLVAGLIPAVMASRLSPVEAMRSV